ncbi:pilus assembly protein PilP [Psychromonas sp. PT13]|uniref:pilus assembly protein PilP n=1 Tax=Psychromonas sp. PT13 TaxID=3439547 RepID=UPI003EC0E2A4
MRILPLLLMTLPLYSCVEVKVDDLEEFVVKTKSQVYPINDKVPTLKKIEALSFDKAEGRNPFSEPKAEVPVAVANTPKSCPQPNFDRKKHPLETYSLDNLSMRGTLTIDNKLWALVKVSGGELYKVKPGDYLGLNYGKVLKITTSKVEILELAADKDGCWQERITQIMLKSQ